MAGKTNAKSTNNFDKIKREMTKKMQKAEENQDLQATEAEGSFHENRNDISENSAGQSQEEAHIAFIGNTHNGNEDIKEEKEAKEEMAPEEHKEVQNDIFRTKKLEIIVFKLEQEEFAIKISNIKEIIRVSEIVKVPSAHPYIIGLCSLRWELLPVIDSRKLFGMPHKELDESSRIIVMDILDMKVGLVSDKGTEVIHMDEDAIKEPPGCIKEMDGGVVNGMLLLDDGERVIMLLDATKIMQMGKLGDKTSDAQSAATRRQLVEDSLKEELQIVIFSSGVEEFSFNIHNVKEIIRVPNFMKVPNTPDYIEGVFSLRNELVAVVNIGKFFGLGCQPINEYSRVIILDNGRFPIGVIVDKVSHVTSVPCKLLEDHISIANGENSGSIEGVFKLNGGKRLVMLLEPFILFNTEEVKGILKIDHTDIGKDKVLVHEEDDKGFEHIVIFKLDEKEYGIAIHNVKEITQMTQITHFPGAPVFISGMVNHRGDILPLLNLRSMFQNQVSSSGSTSKFISVDFENKKIGIMIDSATEVLKIPKNCIVEVTEVFYEKFGYIDKIAKLSDGERNILILDLKSIVSFM